MRWHVGFFFFANFKYFGFRCASQITALALACSATSGPKMCSAKVVQSEGRLLVVLKRAKLKSDREFPGLSVGIYHLEVSEDFS